MKENHLRLEGRRWSQPRGPTRWEPQGTVFHQKPDSELRPRGRAPRMLPPAASPSPSPQTQAAAPSPWGTTNRSAPKVLPDTLPSISLAQFHPFALSVLFHEGIERGRHLSLLSPQGILESCLNPRAVLKSSSLLAGGMGGSWWRPMTGRRAPSFNPGIRL